MVLRERVRQEKMRDGLEGLYAGVACFVGASLLRFREMGVLWGRVLVVGRVFLYGEIQGSVRGICRRRRCSQRLLERGLTDGLEGYFVGEWWR
jgi:hypothetical protein